MDNTTEKPNSLKVIEYCVEQGIPVGPPHPGQDGYTYSIDMSNLNGLQFTTINNLLNG